MKNIIELVKVIMKKVAMIKKDVIKWFYYENVQVGYKL